MKTIIFLVVFGVMACGPLPKSQTRPQVPARSQSNDKYCLAVEQEFKKVPQVLKHRYKFSHEDIKKEFVDYHNLVRGFYNLPNLVWNEEIARYAQDWANYLRDNKQCQMAHRSALNKRDGKKWGENLAYSWLSNAPAQNEFMSSPRWATLAWSDECKDYSYDSNECRPNEQCGHFTQVIWRNSQSFGCGVAVCNERGGQAEVWVCNYDPPGNMSTRYADGRIEKQKPY